jgi:hypothetical protein
MVEMSASVELVVVTDAQNNRYAFTREQLADARLSDDEVTSETVQVGAELNKRPGGRW